MTTTRWRIRALGGALLGLLLVSGCSATLGDVPLPGTGVPGDTITIKVDFKEALNLAQGATVKVNGVDSGKVQKVVAKDFQAQAEMLVREDAELREGATARLRYTTPLGELFVDVTNPPTGEPLDDGAVLTTRSSSTAPTVEDALSQASLLINGGGLAQLQTVTEELNAIVGGREDEVRSFLEGSATFLTEANATTDDIDLALRSLSSVARTLQSRERVINRALREIRPAAAVLRRSTPGLTKLLREIERFSAVANDTVGKTRADLLSLVRQAQPVLAEFTRNRGDYAVSLEQLVSLGDNIDNLVPGDYVSISLATHLDGIALPDLGDLLDELLGIELPIDLPLLRGGAPERRSPLGEAGLRGLVGSPR
jgi:phospholipid/cholesterol/gamma-HCH transport system substrate-binding protein